MATHATFDDAATLPRLYRPRCEPRATLSLPVLISFLGRTHPARLRNMSSRGAMVEMPIRVRTGDRVLLRCGTISASADVIWQEGDRTGLKFVAALSAQEMASQLWRSDQLRTRQRSRDGNVHEAA